MEYNPATKSTTLLVPSTTWMNLKIILNESLIKEHLFYDYFKKLKCTQKPMLKKIRTVVASRAWEQGLTKKGHKKMTVTF